MWNFSVLLRDLRLVKSVDKEPQIQEADYKSYRDFRLHKGSAPLFPCCQGSDVIGKYSTD